MSDPAIIAVETLRAELRRRRHAAVMPRLWHSMREAWQRTQDRLGSGSGIFVPARTERRIVCQAR